MVNNTTNINKAKKVKQWWSTIPPISTKQESLNSARHSNISARHVIISILMECWTIKKKKEKIIWYNISLCWIKDLYSRKDTNLVLSRGARFYATTEQKLIHSFCNALRIRRKINQLHQSLCYTSSIYYTTQNNPWICRYRFNGNFFFCITPHTRKIKKGTVEFHTSKTY